MTSANMLRANVADATAMLQTLLTMQPQVDAAASLLSSVLLGGRKLLTCGNGGSAADASHMATEFVVRFMQDRRAYPAVSLATQGGDLTAIGNDYGFDDVFSRQVHAFGQPGDVLFAFTTSGNSENVVRALHAAKERDVRTVAFLGRDGGRCRGLAEIELVVDHTVTARIQEAHKLLLHTVCEMVEVDLQAAEGR